MDNVIEYSEGASFIDATGNWEEKVETGKGWSYGAEFFIKKNLHSLLEKGPKIDVVLLACTHYPLMQDRIREHLPVPIKLLSQGELVADSLADYLIRHPEIEAACSKTGKRIFFTTDAIEDFDNHATAFFGDPIKSSHVDIG